MKEQFVMTTQHRCKDVNNLLKQLEKRGFSVSSKSKRGGVKICPPLGTAGSVYHTHATQSSLHQIKRDFKKMYNVELD